MLLAAGFFDESLDANEPSNQRCYAVAGFVGGQDPAVVLDLKWRDALAHYRMPYFKASELEMGFGCFSHLRDDPANLKKPLSGREKDLIRQIKTTFVDIIVEADGWHGIGTVLMTAELARFQKDEPQLAKRLPDAYHLCAQLTMMEAGQMMTLSNREVLTLRQAELMGNLRPIFDSQQEYCSPFIAAFDDFRRLNPVSSEYLLPPQYEDDNHYMALQAADLLAYEARKLLIWQEYEKALRAERKAMVRLKERSVRRIYKLDYDSLRVIAQGQPPDVIPIPAALESNLQLEF